MSSRKNAADFRWFSRFILEFFRKPCMSEKQKKQKTLENTGFFKGLWRRVWDSNPRGVWAPNGFQDRLVMTASITLRVDYLIVLFLCFFSPLEFSIEIILGKYFTVWKTACFEPLSEVAVLHHRAAVRHFKTASLWPLRNIRRKAKYLSTMIWRLIYSITNQIKSQVLLWGNEKICILLRMDWPQKYYKMKTKGVCCL